MSANEPCWRRLVRQTRQRVRLCSTTLRPLCTSSWHRPMPETGRHQRGDGSILHKRQHRHHRAGTHPAGRCRDVQVHRRRAQARMPLLPTLFSSRLRTYLLQRHSVKNTTFASPRTSFMPGRREPQSLCRGLCIRGKTLVRRPLSPSAPSNPLLVLTDREDFRTRVLPTSTRQVPGPVQLCAAPA